MIAWALTYVLHCTLLVVAAEMLTRTPWGRAARTRDAIWKCALAGGLLTATLQQAIGGPLSLAMPVLAPDSLGAIEAARSAPAGERETIGVSRVFSGMPWMAVTWAVISGLAALRLACGWLQVRRAAGRRRVLTTGSLRRELDAILQDAGITRRFTLSCSRGLTVPRAIGTREICVPVRVLRDLSPAEQRALLAHETAHLLRHDGVWLFAAAVLQTVLWWQPLTRVAAARLRHAMELSCDDWAASRLPDRMALAECLVKVGEWGVLVPRGVQLAAFAAHGSTLRERVERLMDTDRLESRAARGSWPAAVLLLVVLALAPRVTLAVAAAAVAPPPAAAMGAGVVVPDVAAPAGESRPAAPARRRAVRAVSPPVQSVSVQSSGTADGPVRAMPALDPSPLITMPEPLLQPSPSSSTSGLRHAAAAAARSVPPTPAREPIVGKDDLARRSNRWLEFNRRAFSFDPLYPRY